MNRSLTNLLGLTLLALPLVASLLWLVWIYNGLIDKGEGVRSDVGAGGKQLPAP